MRTNNFQLTDSSIEVFKSNEQVVRLAYADINSIRIHDDTKYSTKQFAIVYWTTWVFFVFGGLLLPNGVGNVFRGFKEISLWGIIIGLGLLAYKPIYSMLPKGTFMDIESKGNTERVSISDIVEDERIHALINHLKQKMELSKIRISN